MDQLLAVFPELPYDYLRYMLTIGWGESRSGHTIYSGPVSPQDFPQLGAANNRILIGDDGQGYFLGYDFASNQYGEYSSEGRWLAFATNFVLEEYLNNIR